MALVTAIATPVLVPKRPRGRPSSSSPTLCLCRNFGHSFVVPTVAGCIDLVVHIATEHDGRRAVREVVAVPGRVEGDTVETADLFRTVDGRLVRAEGWPPHPERFARLGFDLTGLLATYGG